MTAADGGSPRREGFQAGEGKVLACLLDVAALLTPLARSDRPEWSLDRRRYDCGMTTKVAISLPDEVLESARQAVSDGRADSLSGYIAATLAERQGYEDLAALLADMAKETGGPSEKDRLWARRALGLS